MKICILFEKYMLIVIIHFEKDMLIESIFDALRNIQ